MLCSLLLSVVGLQRAAILRLFARGLVHCGCIVQNFPNDGLAREGHHKDLCPAARAQYLVPYGLLNVEGGGLARVPRQVHHAAILGLGLNVKGKGLNNDLCPAA